MGLDFTKTNTQNVVTVPNTKEEIMVKIDEAHARLVEEYGALAPSKEDFEMIVLEKTLEKIDNAILHGR